jgi:hypothetical protein
LFLSTQKNPKTSIRANAVAAVGEEGEKALLLYQEMMTTRDTATVPADTWHKMAIVRYEQPEQGIRVLSAVL